MGCNDIRDDSKRLILEAAKSCEGVLSESEPEAIPVAIADYTINTRLRWWTESDRSSVIHTFGRVIESVYSKLDDNGIAMTYPTSAVLWHDQTIKKPDSDRKTQREGWPAGRGDVPKKARAVQEEATSVS